MKFTENLMWVDQLSNKTTDLKDNYWKYWGKWGMATTSALLDKRDWSRWSNAAQLNMAKILNISA